jgi:FlgD Ig-like domain
LLKGASFEARLGAAFTRALLAFAATGALATLAPIGDNAAFAADPNDASIYEVQTGAFSTFTFVVCDSVLVTAEGPTGFWVEEPAGGARSGIYVNAISNPPPPLGPGTRVTVGGLYRETTGNSELNISSGFGGYVTVVDSTGNIPAPAVLTVGDLRTGSPTAEDWEGVLVQVDTVLAVDTTASSDWRVIEIDGDSPGETLLVDNIMTYAEPPTGTFIAFLTGVMQALSTTNFALEPRSDLDVQVPDSLPPGAVSDLAAVSGTYQGEIDLSWTAPGDDGTSGKALSYTMRRNSVPITEGNWASSTNVAGAPTPAIAGTPQSMTVIGLDPGVTYYFAIKARDEAGNESAISNSPSADASTNPPITYQVFWGNMHSHTDLSDGFTGGSPLRAFTYARDTANVDILAITDHSHYLTQSEYTSLRALSDQFNAAGGFVAIPAQELGIANSDGYGHMNVWDAPSAAGSGAWENLSVAYDFVIAANKPVAFNHPVTMNGESMWNNFAYDFSADAVVEGIEVRNGKRSSDYESQYFQVLANGWHVGALANQDNHQGKWGDQQNQNSGNDIYLTGILADALTKDAVMEALANRRFYACEINPVNDRVTLNFSADGRIMGSIYDSGDRTIAITASAASVTSNLSTYNLYRNGSIIKTGSIGSTSWNFTHTDTVPADGDYYYFLRLQQADFDKTWSSPIWVTVEDAVTGVGGGVGLPLAVSLSPGVPNPFNPLTKIEYALPSAMKVDLAIYDISGRRIATLATGQKSAGRHETYWGGADDRGVEVASGVYFARLETPEKSEMRKLVLLK